MREQEGEQEHDREDRRNDADVLDLARAELDERVRDEARRDTVRDGIGEAHHRNGEERGDSRRRILPVDARNVAHHQHADIQQSARRCAAGNERRDGAEEHGDCKQNGNDESREARSAAFRNARGGFDEGRDRGGTADRARAGSDGVAQERLLDIFDLTRIVEQTALLARRLAGAHQRADGIEHVDHGERDQRCDEIEYLIAADALEAVDERLTEGLRAEVGKRLQRVIEGNFFEHFLRGSIADREGDRREDIIQHGAADDAEQHGTLDLQFREDGDDQEGEQRDGCGHGSKSVEPVRQNVKGNEFDEGGVVVDHNARLLQTDKRNEQTDARGNRQANRRGNGADDHFARADDRENEEQNARAKHDEQRVCIGIPESTAYRKTEKGVQTHAGRLCERNFRQKRH